MSGVPSPRLSLSLKQNDLGEGVTLRLLASAILSFSSIARPDMTEYWNALVDLSTSYILSTMLSSDYALLESDSGSESPMMLSS